MKISGYTVDSVLQYKYKRNEKVCTAHNINRKFNLLNQIKKLLWTTKSEKMSNTTEIPPHVVSMVTLEKIVIMFLK